MGKTMSGKSLADAAMIRGGRVHLADCADAKLLLEEVREIGLPAYFFDHGERLLFLDGDIFDLREVGTAARDGASPMPLPHGILETGVGLEYGWRHAAGCACPHCRDEAQAVDRRGAVA
jgi:hypothetical protein